MKFLIVGCGMIADTHARVLKQLGQEVTLCDCMVQNMEQIGEHYNITERYFDSQTAIVESGADAVVVCTPNHLHADVAIAAMRQGMDVLCEKPMAATAAQARRMLQAVEETGKKLMVAYPLRSGEPLLYVKQVLETGSLGCISSVRCVLAAPETLTDAKSNYRCLYETGGGIIYDYTHEIDYLRFLFGEPGEGFCFIDSFFNQEKSVDDNADILLRFVSGQVAHLHMDYIQERGRGRGRCFELIGENGYLFCDFKDVRIAYNDGTDIEMKYGNEWDPKYIRQAQTFMKVCSGESVSYATAKDGLRVMEIADALYKSGKEKRMIYL